MYKDRTSVLDCGEAHDADALDLTPSQGPHHSLSSSHHETPLSINATLEPFAKLLGLLGPTDVSVI